LPPFTQSSVEPSLVFPSSNKFIPASLML